MSYLLDTCVISELVQKSPNPKVVDWLNTQDEESLFLSALTIGELEKGITALGAGGKRDRLNKWVREELLPRFEGRVLPIDEKVALRWGQVTAAAQARGFSLSTIDSLLAATALEHRLELVTRNVADMKHSGVHVLNPWETV